MNIFSHICSRLRYFSDLEDRLDSFASQFVDVGKTHGTLRALYEVLKARADAQTLTIEGLMVRVRRLEERPERAVEVGDLIARVRLLEERAKHGEMVSAALKPPTFVVKG